MERAKQDRTWQLMMDQIRGLCGRIGVGPMDLATLREIHKQRWNLVDVVRVFRPLTAEETEFLAWYCAIDEWCREQCERLTSMGYEEYGQVENGFEVRLINDLAVTLLGFFWDCLIDILEPRDAVALYGPGTISFGFLPDGQLVVAFRKPDRAADAAAAGAGMPDARALAILARALGVAANGPSQEEADTPHIVH